MKLDPPAWQGPRLEDARGDDRQDAWGLRGLVHTPQHSMGTL